MDIHIINKQKDLKISVPFIRKIVKEVISYEGQECQEVTVNFVTTKAICRLHADFFDDPTPTDCISFPMDEEGDATGHRVLGEIFVCPKTALDYAASHSTDSTEELILYVIHGLLHLMGYDDIDKEDRKKMRAAERRHIKHVKALY